MSRPVDYPDGDRDIYILSDRDDFGAVEVHGMSDGTPGEQGSTGPVRA